MTTQSAFTNALENEIIRGFFRTKKPIAWAASTAKSLGDWVFFTSGSDVYIAECVAAGTTGGTAPSFSTTLGATTTDNTVTWRTHGVGALKTALYFGLHNIRGKWIASTAYALNDYVVPNTHNGRLYKCTTAGTSAASEPTWPLTDGGTVADGGATWTEQTVALEAGTFPAEVSGGSYARAAHNPADANWDDPVSGDGHTQNSAAIQFPAPTANWNVVGVLSCSDASTGGTIRWSLVLNDPKTINSGDAAPSFAIGALDFTVG